MMKKKVVVAMSGGVDSSVTAALLQKRGYEVIGVTMCFSAGSLSPQNDPPDKEGRKPSCCGLTGIEDARRVCHKLGIKHYVLNFHKSFQRRVVDDFYAEYLSGRTPNPCVRCNQFIKFDELLKKALNLGAGFLATGHYARIVRSGSSCLLKKARDRKKDQSYFLYRLTQEQLKHLIFPLGNLAKPEVRKLAADFGLAVALKQDSQEICFVPAGKYGKFIQASRPEKVVAGDFVDQDGKLLGRHRGIVYYTIGQRHGLGIAAKYPLYVTRIDARRNRVILGPRAQVYKKEFIVKDAHFLRSAPKKKIEIKVRIRYNHKEAAAAIYPDKNKLKIVFRQPQFAVTPGQSAVFYQRDTLCGGGIIF